MAAWYPERPMLGGVASAPARQPLPVRLEPASPRDARALAEISRRQIEQGLGWRWTPPRIAHHIRAPESEVVVARAGRTLCGFAVMEYAFLERRAHLVLLAVESGWRRRGTGRTLFAWLEKMARAGGVLQIALEVRAGNADARAFYAAQGFAEGGVVRGYYQGREDAVQLHKSLASRLS
jgi:[ribosomal protein S18]-alanine N-acetyltransferase